MLINIGLVTYINYIASICIAKLYKRIETKIGNYNSNCI